MRVVVNIIILGVSGAVVFGVCVGLDGWWHDHELCKCSGSGGVRDTRFVYEHGADCEYDEGGGHGLLPVKGARVLVLTGAGVVCAARRGACC